MYELTTKQFSGPLALLLEMIEARKMDITDVSLAEVTADFLDYTRMLQEKSTTSEFVGHVADFLVVASRLLLLKSKSLLPNIGLAEDDQVEINELKVRLELYKKFKSAEAHINELFSSPRRLFVRPFLFKQPISFSPPDGVTVDILHSALRMAVKGARQFQEEETLEQEKAATIEEKMEEIIGVLIQRTISFLSLAKNQSRQDVIVLFLALLHLFHEQRISIKQDGVFADIAINKN